MNFSDSLKDTPDRDWLAILSLTKMDALPNGTRINPTPRHWITSKLLELEPGESWYLEFDKTSPCDHNYEMQSKTFAGRTMQRKKDTNGIRFWRLA
jgi:hypothetical protein